MVEAMEDPAVVAHDHVFQQSLCQVHGRGDIDVDDFELIGEVSVNERTTFANAGIQRRSAHRPPGRDDRGVELLYPS